MKVTELLKEEHGSLLLHALPKLLDRGEHVVMNIDPVDASITTTAIATFDTTAMHARRGSGKNLPLRSVPVSRISISGDNAFFTSPRGDWVGVRANRVDDYLELIKTKDGWVLQNV